MTTTIRPLAAADEAEWRRLWAGYLEFYEASVTEEVYRTTFARLLGDDAQDYHGLVAEQGGTPIGLTHYLFHRHCWRGENVIYLPSVYWLTQEFNATARKLYDRVAMLTPFVKYQR